MAGPLAGRAARPERAERRARKMRQRPAGRQTAGVRLRRHDNSRECAGACTRDGAPRARLLHRRTSQERHLGAVSDAARLSADPHAAQGAVVLRARAPLRAIDTLRRRSAGVPRAVRRCHARAADRRGDDLLPVLARGRPADRRGAAERAHHRDPARAGELPALAAPAVRPLARRDRARPAHGARARAAASRGQAAPAQLDAPADARSTPSTSATSSSCAAITRRSRPSRCWC